MMHRENRLSKATAGGAPIVNLPILWTNSEIKESFFLNNGVILWYGQVLSIFGLFEVEMLVGAINVIIF